MFPLESFKTAACPSEFGVDRVTMGTEQHIEITLKTRDGCVVPIGDTDTVKYLLKQMYWSNEYRELDAIVLDGNAGLIQVTFPCDVAIKPGIYLGEIDLYDEDGCRTLVMFRYLEVAPTLDYQVCGPLTIPEIRLILRDNCPSDNTLLDDVEFTDLEIAYCMRRPIDLWNETPPNLGLLDPTCFPWREHWSMAVVGFLYRMAAHHYRRNNLSYQAAGLAVNDKNKYNEYEQIAQMRLEEYKAWIRQKKIELNMNAGYGILSSGYSNYYTYGWR